MKSRHSTKFLFIGGTISLLFSLFLFCALILSAMYKQYREAQLSVYSHTAQNLSQAIERTARLGIEPSRMSDLDNKTMFYAKKNNVLLIVDEKSKKILSAWNYSDAEQFIFPEKTDKKDNSFIKDNILWTVSPIAERDGSTVAYALAGADNQIFAKQIYEVIKEHIKSFAFTAAAGILLLFFFCRLASNFLCQKKSRFLIYCTLLVPLVCAQTFIGISISPSVISLQEENLKQAGNAVCENIIQDTEHIYNLGISVFDIQKSFADHIQKLHARFPWLKYIKLTENNRTLLFIDGKTEPPTQWNKEKQGIYVSHVSFRQNYRVEIFCSTDGIKKNITAILLDTLTITLISFVFMVELLHFVILKEEQRSQKETKKISDSPKFMRTIIFLCIFGTSMPISFLPLRMAEISPDLFGLPKDIVMSLPLSCETLITGISLFFGGILAQKKGWRPLMLWGSLLVFIGSVGSGLAENALTYIVSRCLSGYGYGYIYLMSQVFVIAKSNPQNRTENISAMLAGLYAGLLCGSAFGGLVADRFGYAPVFLVIASVIGTVGLSILFFVPKEPNTAVIGNNTQKIKKEELLRFFSDAKMLGLLLLHIIPCAFVTTCLFQFYIPVSLDNAGVSPAGIGRISMIFCLVIVYIGPSLGTVIDKSSNKAKWIFYADLTGILSVIVLAWLYGIWAAVLSVFLLGICNTIVYSVQGVYALELSAAKEFGEAKAMTVYNVAERIGQVLGPVILGTTITLFGSTYSLYGMAAVFLMMCLLFIFTAQKKL